MPYYGMDLIMTNRTVSKDFMFLEFFQMAELTAFIRQL